MSEIGLLALATYLRLDFAGLSGAELAELETILKAAKAYVLNYTGLTEREANRSDDIAVAAMVVAQDFYDNRTMAADRNYVNITVRSLLDARSVNIAPKGAGRDG
jgi:hypothetical protein